MISTIIVYALTSDIYVGEIEREGLTPGTKVMNVGVVPATESLTNVKVTTSPVSESDITGKG